MSRARTAARLAAATICLVLAAACTDPGHPPVTTTTTSTVPPATAPLVRWQAIGGFCPPTGCGYDLQIAADGSWVVSKGTPAVVTKGRLDATETAELSRQVALGIGSVAALPAYNGPCPFAIDAPETIWTFTGGGRTVSASNCEKVFGANALIQYAGRYVNQLVFPTPPAAAPVLVEWTSKGGRCPEGVCFRSVRLATDGGVVVRHMDDTATGQLPPPTTAEVTRRVAEGVGTLVNVPTHPRGCPSAYDGQDVTWLIRTGDAALRLSNCTQVIPTDNALLQYLGQVLDLPAGPLAPPA